MDDEPIWEPPVENHDEDEVIEGELEPQEQPEAPLGENVDGTARRSWPAQFVQALLEENVVDNARQAMDLLNSSDFDPDTATVPGDGVGER